MNEKNKSAKSLTKAESILFIQKKLRSKIIPKFLYFTKQDFQNKKKSLLRKINLTFRESIIIRSSAKDEDSKKLSNAGKYNSIIIKKKEFYKIEDSINILISEFKKKNDQILIQKLIDKPEISGVLFTKDKNTNSHYYQISFDTSKRSDLVTSGKFNPSLKSLIIFKKSKKVPKKFSKLIEITKNLEKIFKNDRLDIEFCIKNNKLNILQCRPLLGKKTNVNIEALQSVIINLKKKFQKIQTKTFGINGRQTVLSNMSDWNPVEMIGKKPSKLASSLYSELITNKVWSEQRSNYGYKNVSPNRLMLDMAGSPYIDLRIDLNSFLPKNLDENISKKIINNSINKLIEKPFLHDKIEFEIINTCYTSKINKNNLKYLSKNEINNYLKKLKDLTNNILINQRKYLLNDINKIKLLNKKIDQIKKSKLSHIQKIYYLIDNCKNYGTLPFSGIARCAFISKSILDSLVENKILTNNEINKLFLSINTISKKINNDYINSLKNKNFNNFLKNYGHLRPSTYSISIDNYRDNFKSYFSNNLNELSTKKTKQFKLSKEKIRKIDKIFVKKGLNIKFNKFLSFAIKSIENREYAKLIFSKSIDEIFKNLKKLAKEIKVDYKDFEHLDIDIILKSFSTLEQQKLKNIILLNIKSNKKSSVFSKFIKTPDFIKSHNDFDYFYENSIKENYITEKEITGEINVFNHKKNFKGYNNKIIVIENADPGYDFLFSYKISGLITKYGGANSHMAIRCMELGLPSIIGVGEKNYNQILNSKKIYIDCMNKKFKIII
jgi:phosphohistidine swiveling domain-containing protein